MKYKAITTKLSEIGIQLSKEKSVDKLLQMILETSVSITNSDAGTIYYIDEDYLIFKNTINHSVSFPFKEFHMPLDDKTISGYCATHKKILNLPDMQNINPAYGLTYNDTFDKKVGYQSYNMLNIPLEDYSNKVIGVLQLINKKKCADDTIGPNMPEKIADFTDYDIDLVYSLSSQAAILIERNLLFDELSELLDSIIFTLSKTLDQRDPITNGHSERVAKYSEVTAKFISNDTTIFSDVHFSDDEIKEIYIAGLLHDIGKIGVPEWVLQKQNKLTDAGFDAMKYRQMLILCHLSHKERTEDEEYFFHHHQEILEILQSINHSGFLSDDKESLVEKLYHFSPVIVDNMKLMYLTDEEYKQFMIKRGNLTATEREFIQKHVVFSEDALSKIKWTSNLKNVPHIAASHHEKLNGHGYPKGLTKSSLTIRDRILPIIDIYDALTAKDRPYKPAMPVERALRILEEEVERGALDANIVRVFIDNKLYERI